MSGLLQDVRYALRQLRNSLGFSVLAVFTLSLGISASVAIFTFVDAALLKPLPYQNPSRLADVTEGSAMFPRANISYADYVDWRKENTVFSSLEVWTGGGFLYQTPNGAV